MINNLKALLVVMALALVVFHIAKPLCLSFMDEASFKRRRNLWITLTVAAFVSPNFWLYALVALFLAFTAAKKDSNPIALYVLLMHVIPPISVEIPPVLVNNLFDLNNYRILTFSVLLPAAWRLVTAKKKINYGNNKAIDRFMWGYIALQLVALIPYEDLTNTFRRGFLMVLDSYVFIYVISRTCIDRKKIMDIVAVYCLVSAIFVPIAVFESVRLWLPYTELANAWGIENRGAYLFRDGDLRAQVSTGHSLALGFLLAMSFGFWLFVSTYAKTNSKKILGSVGVWAGLIAALSRAPWLTAILAAFVYLALNENGFKKLTKTLLVLIPVGAIALISPIGQQIIDKLPFVGTVDSFNVDYRQRLAESSWILIKENPLFGDPLFETHLESMRQGEGIIDLVNVYASIAMQNGSIGLFLFIGPFLWALYSAWKRMRGALYVDRDLAHLGAAIIACMAGTAFFMATGSFYGALPQFYYLIVGLAHTYGQLKHAEADNNTKKYK